MSKRKTIGIDPLAVAEGSRRLAIEPVFPETMVAGDAVAVASFDVVADQTIRHTTRSTEEKAGKAVGGRLEILGGDIGAGTCVIWRFGHDERIGFVTSNGKFIDLESELHTCVAWPDRAEHRLLSAAGWAWALASIGGIFGLIAGGGIRLLQPRRMIFAMSLFDGRNLVARTDSVTAAALEDIARGHANAREPCQSKH